MIHVLGSINIDYSCSVKTLPQPGETVRAVNLFTTPGGKGANQAVAARRAGSAVKMYGAVGKDEIAQQALSYLSADGIDITSVAEVEGPSGCAFVFVDAHSENQIVIVPGANASASSLPTNAVTSADLLLLQLEIPAQIVIEAAATAYARGAKVIVNLAPYQSLPPGFFDSVDLVLVNQTEAELLAADLNVTSTSDELAVALSRHLQTTVVMTLGADGVIAADEDNTIRIAGTSVEAVDTVGAGDTFAGYLGSRLEHGDSLGEACRIANLAAALACTKSGAQSAIPTYDAIDDL